jgi:hypothetical protein
VQPVFAREKVQPTAPYEDGRFKVVSASEVANSTSNLPDFVIESLGCPDGVFKTAVGNRVVESVHFTSDVLERSQVDAIASNRPILLEGFGY